jgi:GPH family glycoside/pentoside/hexuronide:cation symporter
MQDKGKGGARATSGKAAETRLSFGIKLSYGIGDVASNFFIVATGMYLLYFLIEVVGVNPVLAGTALFIPKFWDVILDPIVGGISDRTKSRFGRRRPYLLYGAVPYGVAFFLLFLAPHYQSEMARAVHVSIVFAAGCTVFALINVPYSSMVAEMTDDYNERMSLTSFRMIFASIGALLAGGLAMPLVKLGGEGEAGFRFMGIVFGLTMIGTCLICVWGTRRAPSLPVREVTPSIREQIRITFRNFPFLMLMSSYFFQALAVGVLMAGFIFYVTHAMKLPDTAMQLVFPLFLVTAILFIPAWLAVGKRLGKIRAYMIGLGLFTVMMASLFFTKATQMPLFYSQIFLAGVAFSSFQLFPFSMLPDTVEYDELQSGMRREGVFCGMWSAGQKIAYSVGPPIVAYALALSGFTREGIQPKSVEVGIRIIFCLFPAFVILLSFIPFMKYDLTAERFEELKKEIAKKGEGRR